MSIVNVFLKNLIAKLRGPQAVLPADNGFPSRIPTVTKPTGTGVIDIGSTVNDGAQHAFVIPIGTGANNATFSLRLIAWQLVPGSNDGNVRDLWVPTILAELTATLSAAVGVDKTPAVSTVRFADTITIVKEPVTVADVTNAGSVLIFSQANDLPAWAKVPLHGAQLLEWTITTGGSATAADALVRLV